MAADDTKVEKRRHNEPSRSEPPIEEAQNEEENELAYGARRPQ
jgi:hypothetical protein